MLSSTNKKIIKKWYYKIGFPTEFDQEFEEKLESDVCLDTCPLSEYDTKCDDGIKNLFSYLLYCEALEESYAEKGIPEDILLDTLKDIAVWTKTWSDLKGRLYLGELEWLKRHLEMRLFKLGRLQFCMAESENAIPSKRLAEGDNVIEVHIPEGEPLSAEACTRSLQRAREFFEFFFPEFSYSLFTCHSWLLDTSLDGYLKQGSNILSFAKLFTIVRQDPSDAMFGYLFRWGAKREDVESIAPRSSLAAKVKSALTQNPVFFEGLGYIEKQQSEP